MEKHVVADLDRAVARRHFFTIQRTTDNSEHSTDSTGMLLIHCILVAFLYISRPQD